MDNVGDFTQEYVNDLWAKILEREMKYPNTVSLRTMEVLRNMTKSEGEAFVKICKYVITVGETRYVLGMDYSICETDEDLIWNNLFTSMEAGLINLQSDLQFTFKSYEDNTILLEYQNKKIYVKMHDNIKEIPIHIFLLTQAGTELFPVANIGEEDGQYLQSIIDFFTTNYKCEVRLSENE